MIAVHYAAVQAVGAQYYSDAIVSAWSPTPDENRRLWLAELIEQDSTLCTVAVSEHGKIIGFSIALINQAQLKALYIHPAFEQKGVGRALLERAEEQCRTSGLEALELNASCNAEAFYRSNGYDVLGPTEQPLENGLAMGAIHMLKRFF